MTRLQALCPQRVGVSPHVLLHISRPGTVWPKAHAGSAQVPHNLNGAAIPQQPGMYYGSSPQQSFPQQPQTHQSPPAQRGPPQHQQQTQSRPSAYPQPQYYSQPPQQQQPSHQQQYATGGYPPQQSAYAAPPAYASQSSPESDLVDALPRINPGKPALNTIKIIGSIHSVQPLDRGNAQAQISVPYATKPGSQEFRLEAWSELAPVLLALEGHKVYVEGRLALDAQIGGAVKVVARRFMLIDESAPVSRIPGDGPHASGDQGGSGSAGQRSSGRFNAQEAWRIHYETQTRTVQAIASQMNCQPKNVFEGLLKHAALTRSPLHMLPLAEELHVADGDIILRDFMNLVTRYKEEFAAARNSTHPSAAPPELPVTKDGILKVRPIREWALLLDPNEPEHYVVSTYEATYGLDRLYDVLRLAVVAEATHGSFWTYETEFGLDPQ